MRGKLAVFWFGGFGFGVWRNKWDSNTIIWTMAVGPITLYYRKDIK